MTTELIRPNEKRSGTADLVYALVTLLFGYLFCRAFPFSENPLGGALLLFAVSVFLGVVLLRAKAPVPKTLFFCGGMALLALTVFLQGNDFVRFGSAMLFGFGFFYTLGSCTGLNLEKYPGNYFLFDAIRALFVLPYAGIGSIFGVLFRKKEVGSTGKKVTRTILYVLLGLLAAIFPTMLAVSLLRYDTGFSALIDRLFDFDLGDLFSHLGSFLLGIPVAMLLFSGIYRATRRVGCGRTTDKADALRRSSKVLPVALSFAVLLPLLSVYALFFFSQREYYLAAFGGRLPAGFVFATYAREGFLNLCGVAAVNAALLTGLHLFTKKRGDGESSLPEKLGAILLAAATLLLITTAMAKLVLYISAYGLTVSRLFAAWFMVLLFLSFLAVIVRQFVRKLNLMGLLATLFLLFWAVLALPDWNGIIADHNVNAYLRGELSTVDVNALGELEDSAVPALCRLVEAEPENREARLVLTRTRAYRAVAEDGSVSFAPAFFGRDLPYLRAVRAVKASLPLPGDPSLDRLQEIKAEITLECDGIPSLFYTWRIDGAELCSGGVTPADGSCFRIGEELSFEPVIDGKNPIWQQPTLPASLTLELFVPTVYGEQPLDALKFDTEVPTAVRYFLRQAADGRYELSEGN